jgi:CheY-like chemotaxis protein
MHVLVVDDEASVRILLQLALEDAGYTVSLAANGREALVCLVGGPADIVLTDLQMPGLGGVELFTELRAQGFRIPVVFMSAGTNARSAAVAHGADGYIPKPFDLDTLLSTLAYLLPQRQERERTAGRRSMTEATNPFTIVVINSNDDLLRLLGEVVQAASFAAVTVHADEVGRTTEAIQDFLHRHDPKVVLYDISPPYRANWSLFSSVRDAERLHGSGRQFIVTTPNRAALERFVGSTSAIELVGEEEDRAVIAEELRRAVSA